MADAQLTHFESMTNVELRAELKRRGCPTSGNKKDLLAKLRTALEKEYEQNTNHHETPVTYTNLPIHDQVAAQHSSVYNLSLASNAYPVISIPRQLPISLSVEHEEFILQDNSASLTPEKRTRTRSKKLSVDSQINEIPIPTAINNEQIVLDNSNNVEVNSFVSKSNEEEKQKNIEQIGEEIHSSSIGSSSSAKSESVVKEIPLSDEQQRLNQSETKQISAIDNTNDDIKNSNEIIDQSSKSADLPPITIEQHEISKENESSSINKEPQLKANRSSSIKFPTRSTINKINLTSDLLKTFISDLTLAPESILNDELDSDQNNESILETSIMNDFLPNDSMTIGELADQKQTSHRTVAIDDFVTRKKQNPTPVRLSSFESKTFVDGKTNNIVTDEPVRIKDVTTTHEPPSEILYIRGLTRPFSLMQLKGLLSRYGLLIDGEFWLDKIKSQCFVTYNTLEEAQNAREALDGCRWPSTNPKTLSIRFARKEEFEFSKTHDLPPNHVSSDSTDRVVEEESTSPVDGKEPKNHSDEPKHSGFLITEDEINEESIKTNEQPGKGLDDYFRKTKAKPSIYWLPLTDEEILERVQRQEQRKVERDEEQRKRDNDENIRKSEKRKHSASPLLRQDSKRH